MVGRPSLRSSSKDQGKEDDHDENNLKDTLRSRKHHELDNEQTSAYRLRRRTKVSTGADGGTSATTTTTPVKTKLDVAAPTRSLRSDTNTTTTITTKGKRGALKAKDQGVRFREPLGRSPWSSPTRNESGPEAPNAPPSPLKGILKETFAEIAKENKKSLKQNTAANTRRKQTRLALSRLNTLSDATYGTALNDEEPSTTAVPSKRSVDRLMLTLPDPDGLITGVSKGARGQKRRMVTLPGLMLSEGSQFLVWMSSKRVRSLTTARGVRKPHVSATPVQSFEDSETSDVPETPEKENDSANLETDTTKRKPGTNPSLWTFLKAAASMKSKSLPEWKKLIRQIEYYFNRRGYGDYDVQRTPIAQLYETFVEIGNSRGAFL